MTFSVVGERVKKIDSELQVTGESRYAQDYFRPDMLCAKSLQSAYAHAKILNIDTSAAKNYPGVAAVITAADIPYNRFGVTHQDQPVLADTKVRCFGDTVAVVAATSWEAATEALRLIKVEYEPLPTIFDPVEAMKLESPKVHGDNNLASHLKIRSGDIEQGWLDSDLIIEEKITTQMVEHVHVEPHAAFAELDASGELLIMPSVQVPFLIAADVGKILKMPSHKIRVVTPTIGGGFGGKNEVTVEPYVALLALMTRKPVKMAFTREDEFNVSTVRHPYTTTYKTGLKNDGTLVARKVEIISDAGAYVTSGAATLQKASIHAAGPYRIPNVSVDGYLVYTNNPVGAAMRGFGVTQLGFAYEVHMDTIAAEIGMDPVEFRMKNLFVDNCALPTGQIVEAVTLTECMKEALAKAGWKKEVCVR
jgi:nicotinate dehydrogenase large molybdopterin subunit